MDTNPTNATALAAEFSLEELRAAFDRIPTATYVLAGHDATEHQIGGRTVVTTPFAIGQAKLQVRGLAPKPKRRCRS